MKQIRTLLLLSSCLIPYAAQGSGNSAVGASSLFDLSLDELLSVRVVSKEEESIARSPAIVSTYTADDLQALGLTTLLEFLDFTPSVEVNEAMNGSRILQMRGLPSRSNQKILFLMDGVPYWSPENGDIPFYGMPLEAIEKIEVIRGPGAVVYGTNASAGVINIVSKLQDRSSLMIRTDAEDKGSAGFFHSAEFENGAVWSLSGAVQNDEGYSYRVFDAFNVVPAFSFAETYDGDMRRKSDHHAIYSRFAWEGLEVTVQSYEESLLGSINSTPLVDSSYENTGRLISLKYQIELEKGVIDLYTDWNHFYRQIETEDLLTFFFIPGDGEITFDNNGDNNDRLRQGLSWRSDVSDNWSFLAGLEYERRRTEDQKFRDDANGAKLTLLTQPPYNQPFDIQPDGTILLVESDNTYEKAGYVQAEYSDSIWRLVLGGRYVDNNQAGNAFSPRGAVVYSLSKNDSVKVLFSEGFNSPTFSQIAATDSFGVKTDNDVNAEVIQSWDFAYTHSDQHTHYVLNWFHVSAQDLIFDNQNIADELVRSGLEFEWASRMGAWNLMSGLTYVNQGDGERDNQSEYASKWLMKVGSIYSVGAHRFGGSLRSAGPRRGVSSSHMLNLNYAYRFGNGVEASVLLNNVLDDQALQPNVRQLNDILLQGDERFGLQLALKYRFNE